MEYKHIQTGEVIDQWAYDHITDDGRRLYRPVYESLSTSDISTPINLGPLFEDQQSTDIGASDDSGSSDDFQGFDGGDTGGGGASGDY